MINKKKQIALKNKMLNLKIYEADLVEKFIIGSGKGGQKINKTASCVYLKHIPTKIEIKCQKERSREMNRYFARIELCERITEKIYFEESSRKKLELKIKRQKKRRSRRLQNKILSDKAKRSKKKLLRMPPKED